MRQKKTKHYVLIILPGWHAVDFTAVTHFYRVKNTHILSKAGFWRLEDNSHLRSLVILLHLCIQTHTKEHHLLQLLYFYGCRQHKCGCWWIEGQI